EVNHHIVPRHGRLQRFGVLDVRADHREPWIPVVVLVVPLAPGHEIVVERDFAGGRILQQLVGEVAADKSRTAHDEVPLFHFIDSHFVCFTLSAGRLTKKCHITAQSPSVCVVIRSEKSGGITTQASATRLVKPPSFPTTPTTVARLPFASSSARTRFAETFFSLSPPPTEKIRMQSFSPMRLPSSQPAKHPSQPSSLMRAVSSLTLSVGVYASNPQIFRKSFT